MQLTPHYGDEPVMRSELVVDDPAEPVRRQRRRLADTLAGLDVGQWAATSRCAGWTVQDVVAHLVTTNQFWTYSVTAGMSGEPTTFLETFDPVASPAQMVAASRTWTPDEALARFVETNAAFDDVLASIDGLGWAAPAEAPPGHLPIALVVQHALWDSWIHERDIVVPLGLEPVLETDEIEASLQYAAGLSPAFLATAGSTRRGALDIRVTDPDLQFVVEVGPSVVIGRGPAPAGAVTLTGDAVTILEALSFRGPFPGTLAEDDRWFLGGLAEVFDTSV